MLRGNYQELIVWQKSMDLADEIYKIAKMLPKEEIHGLSDQLRRASISVPSNIAEGHGRGSDKEFVKFLTISRGSIQEVETQILLCVRINLIPESVAENVISLISEIRKMLNSLINYNLKFVL